MEDDNSSSSGTDEEVNDDEKHKNDDSSVDEFDDWSVYENPSVEDDAMEDGVNIKQYRADNLREMMRQPYIEYSDDEFFLEQISVVTRNLVGYRRLQYRILENDERFDDTDLFVWKHPKDYKIFFEQTYADMFRRKTHDVTEKIWDRAILQQLEITPARIIELLDEHFANSKTDFNCLIASLRKGGVKSLMKQISSSITGTQWSKSLSESETVSLLISFESVSTWVAANYKKRDISICSEWFNRNLQRRPNLIIRYLLMEIGEDVDFVRLLFKPPFLTKQFSRELINTALEYESLFIVLNECGLFDWDEAMESYSYSINPGYQPYHWMIHDHVYQDTKRESVEKSRNFMKSMCNYYGDLAGSDYYKTMGYFIQMYNEDCLFVFREHNFLDPIIIANNMEKIPQNDRASLVQKCYSEKICGLLQKKRYSFLFYKCERLGVKIDQILQILQNVPPMIHNLMFSYQLMDHRHYENSLVGLLWRPHTHKFHDTNKKSIVFTALLCFRQLCPQMPKDIRIMLLHYVMAERNFENPYARLGDNLQWDAQCYQID